MHRYEFLKTQHESHAECNVPLYAHNFRREEADGSSSKVLCIKVNFHTAVTDPRRPSLPPGAKNRQRALAHETTFYSTYVLRMYTHDKWESRRRGPPPASPSHKSAPNCAFDCVSRSFLSPSPRSVVRPPFPFRSFPPLLFRGGGGRRAFCWRHLSKCMEEEYLLYLLHLDISLRFECPLVGSDDFLYIYKYIQKVRRHIHSFFRDLGHSR